MTLPESESQPRPVACGTTPKPFVPSKVEAHLYSGPPFDFAQGERRVWDKREPQKHTRRTASSASPAKALGQVKNHMPLSQ